MSDVVADGVVVVTADTSEARNSLRALELEFDRVMASMDRRMASVGVDVGAVGGEGARGRRGGGLGLTNSEENTLGLQGGGTEGILEHVLWGKRGYQSNHQWLALLGLQGGGTNSNVGLIQRVLWGKNGYTGQSAAALRAAEAGGVPGSGAPAPQETSQTAAYTGQPIFTDKQADNLARKLAERTAIAESRSAERQSVAAERLANRAAEREQAAAFKEKERQGAMAAAAAAAAESDRKNASDKAMLLAAAQQAQADRAGAVGAAIRQHPTEAASIVYAEEVKRAHDRGIPIALGEREARGSGGYLQALAVQSAARAAAADAGGSGGGGPGWLTTLLWGHTPGAGGGRGMGMLGRIMTLGGLTAGMGSLGSFAGFGPEHLLMTGVGIAGSALGAAGGLGVKAAGGLGQMAVGGGSDLLVMKSTIADTKTLSEKYTELQKAVAKYGKNSKQAKEAQQELNLTMKELGNTAGVKAELGLAKYAQAVDHFFDMKTGPARVQAVKIADQGLGLGKLLIPKVAHAAQQNLSIVNQGLKPTFAWLEGPEGMGIFDNLERKFKETLPTAMHALDEAVQFFAKTINAAQKYTGGFVTEINKIFTEANSPEGFHKWEGFMHSMILDFDAWKRLIVNVGRDLFDLFSQDAHTGRSIVESLDEMLEKLGMWERSTSGQHQIHNLFTQHKEEVLSLLKLLPIVSQGFGQVYLAIAPIALTVVNPLIRGFVDLLTAFVGLSPATRDLAGIFLILWKFKKLGAVFDALGLSWWKNFAIFQSTQDKMIASNDAVIASNQELAASFQEVGAAATESGAAGAAAGAGDAAAGAGAAGDAAAGGLGAAGLVSGALLSPEILTAGGVALLTLALMNNGSAFETAEQHANHFIHALQKGVVPVAENTRKALHAVNEERANVERGGAAESKGTQGLGLNPHHATQTATIHAQLSALNTGVAMRPLSAPKFALTNYENSLSAMRDDAGLKWNEIRALFSAGSHDIAKFSKEGSVASKEATIRNMQAEVEAVRQGVHNKTISVKKGAELIEKIQHEEAQVTGSTNKQMEHSAVLLKQAYSQTFLSLNHATGSSLGALSKQIFETLRHFVLNPSTITSVPGEFHAGGAHESKKEEREVNALPEAHLRKARGGSLQGMGAPTGDSIPILAERDEYVLSKKAARKIGYGNLDAINYGTYANGGVVEPHLEGPSGWFKDIGQGGIHKVYEAGLHKIQAKRRRSEQSASSGFQFSGGKGTLSPLAWAQIMLQAGFPPVASVIAQGLGVLQVESGFNASETGGAGGESGHIGGWQEEASYGSTAVRLNPLASTQAAYRHWKTSGWSDWAPYETPPGPSLSGNYLSIAERAIRGVTGSAKHHQHYAEGGLVNDKHAVEWAEHHKGNRDKWGSSGEWCGAFLAADPSLKGDLPQSPDVARNWLNMKGRRVSSPRRGDIIVYGGTGHVAIATSSTEQIQGNTVNGNVGYSQISMSGAGYPGPVIGIIEPYFAKHPGRERQEHQANVRRRIHSHRNQIAPKYSRGGSPYWEESLPMDQAEEMNNPAMTPEREKGILGRAATITTGATSAAVTELGKVRAKAERHHEYGTAQEGAIRSKISEDKLKEKNVQLAYVVFDKAGVARTTHKIKRLSHELINKKMSISESRKKRGELAEAETERNEYRAGKGEAELIIQADKEWPEEEAEEKEAEKEAESGGLTPADEALNYSKAREELFNTFSSSVIETNPTASAGFRNEQARHPGSATINNVVNNFAAPPPDPHTWSATQKFALQAMS